MSSLTTVQNVSIPPLPVLRQRYWAIFVAVSFKCRSARSESLSRVRVCVVAVPMAATSKRMCVRWAHGHDGHPDLTANAEKSSRNAQV